MMMCPLCGSHTITYPHPKLSYIFHECKTCEFIFKDPKHHPSLVEEKKRYDQHNNDILDEKYRNYMTEFIEQSVMPFIHHKKALDFGSGPSPVLAHILQHTFGFDVTIYDYIYANDQKYQYQTYDLITSTEVIEHLVDPKKYFIHFYHLLNKEGVLSIMTRFHPKDQKKFFKWFYIRDETHVSFYTPTTLKMLAAQVGFDVLWDDNYHQMVFKKRGE